MRIVVGLSGASGIQYGIRFLEVCRSLEIESHLIMTTWAERNIELETNYSVSQVRHLASKNYEKGDLAAAVSSGSFKHDGMVVVPCSMKTLSAIAHGYSENLLHRAADVTLKEKRKLILAPRETPLSIIHLENLLKAAHAGSIILPPIPAFYFKPHTIDDIINHFVGRVLDQLGVEHQLLKRWGDIASQISPNPEL